MPNLPDTPDKQREEPDGSFLTKNGTIVKVKRIWEVYVDIDTGEEYEVLVGDRVEVEIPDEIGASIVVNETPAYNKARGQQGKVVSS